MLEKMKNMLDELMFDTLGNERFIDVIKWEGGEVAISIYDPMPSLEVRTYASYYTIEFRDGEIAIHDLLEFNGRSSIDVSLLASFIWALREMSTDASYNVNYNPCTGKIYGRKMSC